jgi:hypothetical protein
VCRKCCIAEHKQAVPQSVCAERYFRTISTGQDIHRFLPNFVVDDGDIIILIFVIPYMYLLYLMCICCTVCVLLLLL